MKKVLKKAGSVFLAAALSSSVAAVSVTTVSAFESLPVGFNKNDLAEHTMGIVGEFNRWSEDIAKMTDDDGEVNIADALMISRFDAGLIDKF